MSVVLGRAKSSILNMRRREEIGHTPGVSTASPSCSSPVIKQEPATVTAVLAAGGESDSQRVCDGDAREDSVSTPTSKASLRPGMNLRRWHSNDHVIGAMEKKLYDQKSGPTSRP